MNTPNASFPTFAIVELMGHATTAGFVTEEVVAGAGMLRVKTPDLPEIAASIEEGERYNVLFDAVPAEPGKEKFYSTGAVYCITPCTEEAALLHADMRYKGSSRRVNKDGTPWVRPETPPLDDDFADIGNPFAEED